jgi:hypothetical protein
MVMSLVLHVADEIIHGPDGDVLVPADLERLHADGFIFRRQANDQVLVEILGPKDVQSRCRVIARLAFSSETFGRFVNGLIAVRGDGEPPAWTTFN